MAANKKNRVSIFDTMVLTGVGLGIVFWIIETFYDAIALDGVGFLGGLFGGGLVGIGTRIIAICLFIIFGAHAQYNINKRRVADAEVSVLKTKISELTNACKDIFS